MNLITLFPPQQNFIERLEASYFISILPVTSRKKTLDLKLSKMN